MPAQGSDPHSELARVADTYGAAAGEAQTALGTGPMAGRLRAAILALTRHRGPASSICPSDAARAIGGDRWRNLTAQSRTIAFELAKAGEVEITQRGVVRDPARSWRGPIRIRAMSADRSDS